MRKKIEEWMRSGQTNPGAAAMLGTLSFLYGAGVRLRLALYASGVLESRKLPCRIISVGNITAGGTGKTPVAIYIAGVLKKSGRRVVVVSRGYKGASTGVAVVSDGNRVLLGPKDAGDEPYLMAERLAGVPVVVGADRVAAGLHAIEKFAPEFIVLDDGFQHIRLKRDLNILLVDSAERFGNGHLLPRGVLREPIAGIKRADIVLVRGASLDRATRNLLGGAPAISFDYRPARLYALGNGEETGLPHIKGKKAVALSGLASPASFLKTLDGLGVDVVRSLAFPDHHAYSRADVERVKKEAAGADFVITTEKDAVKLKSVAAELPILVLGIDVKVKEEGRIKKLLLGAGAA